jgi:tight adherence protein C
LSGAEGSANLLAVVSASMLALAAAVSVLCVVLAVDHLRGRRLSQARLARFGLLTADEPEAPAEPRGGGDFLRRLGSILAQRATREQLQQLRLRMIRAGLGDRLHVAEFLGLRVLGVLGGVALAGTFALPLAFMLLSDKLGTELLASAAALTMGGAVGYLVPSLALDQMIKRRRNAIERLVPNAVDVLAISLEAGLGFDNAVAFLCERASNPLIVELRRYLSDLQLGRSRRDALDALVDRGQAPALRDFAAAVIQADELGTGLVRALRTQASALRAARRIHAEELARQAPIKLLFPIVLCILPVLFIVIVGPALLMALAVFGG